LIYLVFGKEGANAPDQENPVVLNSSMNGNEVAIHTTPNSYPESATPKIQRIDWTIAVPAGITEQPWSNVFSA